MYNNHWLIYFKSLYAIENLTIFYNTQSQYFYTKSFSLVVFTKFNINTASGNNKPVQNVVFLKKKKWSIADLKFRKCHCKWTCDCFVVVKLWTEHGDWKYKVLHNSSKECVTVENVTWTQPNQHFILIPAVMFSVQQNITFEATSGLQVGIMKKKSLLFLCKKWNWTNCSVSVHGKIAIKSWDLVLNCSSEV